MIICSERYGACRALNKHLIATNFINRKCIFFRWLFVRCVLCLTYREITMPVNTTAINNNRIIDVDMVKLVINSFRRQIYGFFISNQNNNCPLTLFNSIFCANYIFNSFIYSSYVINRPPIERKWGVSNWQSIRRPPLASSS